MNHYQLKCHVAFVEKHLHVLIRRMLDPDVMIRTAFRNVLPEIPDIYFDAMVSFLESIVDTGAGDHHTINKLLPMNPQEVHSTNGRLTAPPIFYSCRYGHLDVGMVLLQFGKNINNAKYQ